MRNGYFYIPGVLIKYIKKGKYRIDVYLNHYEI